MKNVFAILFLTFIMLGCNGQNSKINAVSFVANPNPINSSHVKPLQEINANYAAVMPFGFLPENDTPQIIFNTDRQWYGETKEGGRNYVAELRKVDIDVMIKPQIWISGGEYTGYLKMATEENWVALEDSYRKFILEYASLAQEESVAIFCIGTELEKFVANRPNYWIQLIKDVRSIYKGKLTYAANWDEYKRVPFWNELDYIGVDAYFPIADTKTPTVAEARAGWQPWKLEIKGVSEAFNKPILFTEYGYRSVDFSGKEPWVSSRDKKGVNMEAQTNLTKALYEELYPEPWFSGGFVWKWFVNHDDVGGLENTRFTPQNKPVAQEIKNVFKQYSN